MFLPQDTGVLQEKMTDREIKKRMEWKWQLGNKSK